MSRPKTVTIELDLNESGTLCHLMTRESLNDGGLMPVWWCRLHQKLMDTNDAMRGQNARIHKPWLHHRS